MTRRSWIQIAVALLIGLLVGCAATAFAYRHYWLRSPGERVLERMDRMLKLTPAQHDQVVGIMHETRAKVEDMRRESHRQRRELIQQARGRIRELLTPEQQANFDRYFSHGPHDDDHGEHHRHWGPPEQ